MKLKCGPAALPQPDEIDQTTWRVLLVVALIVPSFIFDHRVSELMYAVGYAPRDEISNFWFIGHQYEFMRENKLLSDGSTDPFHVFELFVWLSSVMCVWRLGRGVIFLGSAEEVRSMLEKRMVSAVRYFWTWLLGGPTMILAVMFGIDIYYFASFSHRLMAYSPKAFVGFEASIFCAASFFTVAGILDYLKLQFGRVRTKGI